MSGLALRCVLEHLTTRLDDNRRRVAISKARGPVQHVAVWLAWHAHDDGGGIWAAQSTIAAEGGISRRTVQRALDELVDAKVVEVEQHGGKRGTNRYRVRLCALCATETQEGLSASERRGTRVRETHKPNKNTALTDQQRLAMLQAGADRSSGHSGGADRRGGLAPSPAPPAVGQPADLASTPSGQAFAVVREDDPAEPEWQAKQARNEAGMAALLSFPADRTSSSQPDGASTVSMLTEGRRAVTCPAQC
jgi:hypothetical protein